MSLNAGKRKLSGATRRKLVKEKQTAEGELLKKIPKVTSYFSAQPESSSQKSSTVVCSELQEDKDQEGTLTEETELEEEDSDNAQSAQIIQQGEATSGQTSDEHADDADNKFPPTTDIAHFGTKCLTVFEKQFIVRAGSLQPQGPFPKQTEGANKGRCFSEYFYKRSSKSGLILQRLWLSYSPLADKCYCTPCWLFSGTPNQAWTKGTNDWKNLSRSIENHENSETHAEACEVYNTWKNDATVDLLTDKQIFEDRKYWHLVLDRIVNLIITLSRCNLAFRGHREQDDDEASHGNFLQFIHLIARYDPVLENLLKQPKGSTKYLSGSIQNEIIEILANCLKQQIVDEIAESPFVSVIMDTTMDIAKTDQLSKVFRYVTIDKNNDGMPIALNIKESFLGFSEVESQKGSDLAATIAVEIENVTEMRKIRGQGYDGAANMSGAYSGVQTLMKQKAPSARYIHCAAHTLNLVINDAVKNVKELRNFFDMLEKLYVFFSAISRWNRLQKERTCSITLKRLCPTRWSSRNQALIALRSRFVDVMKLLAFLSLSGKNSEEKCEAASLQKYFERFSSVVTVVLLSHILGPLDIISKEMQSKSGDLSNTTILLDSLMRELLALRNNWETTLSFAKVLAESWGVKCDFSDPKRVSRVKKFFDELSRDSRLESPEKRFQVEVFNTVIDITTSQLKVRFHSLRDTDALFQCIKPNIIMEKSVNELIELSKVLVKEYADDISDELCDQMMLLKLTLGVKLADVNTIRELAEFLLIKHAELSSTFSEVITACLLYLTLPVTVASAERSFSKLKLIKTYLRSTMCQVRLSSLGMLSIESQRLNDLNIDHIIDNFADAKSRRKPF